MPDPIEIALGNVTDVVIDVESSGESIDIAVDNAVEVNVEVYPAITISGSGGVTAFNGRTGNVTLTSNDVTTAANGLFLLNQYGTANTSYGVDVFYGLIKNPGIVNSQDPTKVYPFYAGKIGVVGERGIVGLNSSTDPCNIEFQPGDLFNLMRFRSYNQSFIFSSVDGLYAETGTANWNWTANTVLTQGRGDARYQPVGSYLTSANLTWSNLTGKPTFATVATSGSYTDLANTPNLSLYQLVSTNTWANLTGKPSLATVATSGAYADLSGTPNLSLYYLANNPTGYITSANLTYGNISGTPNLSLYYLANNPSGYITASCLTYSNITGTPNLSLYPTFAANNSFTGCNTFTGQINCNSTLALSGNLVTSPKLQSYSETANAPTISSGNLTLNLSLANVFGPVTLNANISNLTISNPPASGTAGSFTLLLKANGTAFTVTWPSAVKWAGGTAPTVTSTANKTDIFSFVTTDGGTTYFGFKSGQNF